MRYGSELIRRTIGAVFDVLDQEKFITQTVRKVLFGYANPLIKLGNDMLPKGTIKWPSSLFGILVGVIFRYILTGKSSQVIKVLFACRKMPRKCHPLKC